MQAFDHGLLGAEGRASSVWKASPPFWRALATAAVSMSLRPASTTARSSSALGGTTQDVGSRTSRQQPPKPPTPGRSRRSSTQTAIVRDTHARAGLPTHPPANGIKTASARQSIALGRRGDDGRVDARATGRRLTHGGTAPLIGAVFRTPTLAALRRPTSAALGNGILRPETRRRVQPRKTDRPANRRRRPRSAHPLKVARFRNLGNHRR